MSTIVAHPSGTVCADIDDMVIYAGDKVYALIRTGDKYRMEPDELPIGDFWELAAFCEMVSIAVKCDQRLTQAREIVTNGPETPQDQKSTLLSCIVSLLWTFALRVVLLTPFR